MKSALFALCLLPGLAHSDAGRFQIASGHYRGVDSPTPIMIKIDTWTGETWQLLEMPVGVGPYPKATVIGWSPLYDDVSLTLQDLQRSFAPSNTVRLGPVFKPGRTNAPPPPPR